MKIIVCGLGDMGHGTSQTLADHPDVKQVYAYDIDPKKCNELKNKRHNLLPIQDLDKALNDPEVKLVFVTASNAAHYSLTMAALKAGKAVMCEKPIANTLADARAMVAEAEKRNLFFQIGFELRYSKLYTKVKEWIDAGLLGQVVNTQCTYCVAEFHGKGSWRNNYATGGSLFGEKLCHYIDLPRWWIGSDVTEVYSLCAPNVVPYFEVHDNYQTSYKFANGAISHLTFCMNFAKTFDGDPLKNTVSQQMDDGHELRYLVVGQRGAAATDVFRRTIRRWEFGDSPEKMTSKLVDILTWKPEEDYSYYHNGYDQNYDIVRRVRDNLPPATPARDALKTMELVFAADKSADEKRVVLLSELQ